MTTGVGPVPGCLSVLDVIRDRSRRALDVYRADPGLIEEHANGERRISQGGYGDRQVFELVQNAADEIRATPGGEIAVVLTPTHLYCANEGSPVTPEGADTILRMSVSRKRGGQIGRFGVGVKSVLTISDSPEFFSTVDGVQFGFGFDREWSAGEIRRVHPGADEMPVLRMARVLDPRRSRDLDRVLDELSQWATTVVRLPLKSGSVTRLGLDLRSFPVEFPLFSPHVGTVTLEDRRGGVVWKRQIFQRCDGVHRTLQEVRTDDSTIDHRWRVFSRGHRPSARALSAAGELHDRPEIDISWAVPGRSGSRGVFWAYFPTKFATTLRGILNAPWKTSEDRQAIFDGNAFNDELIGVAAELVIESLPQLTTAEDPACYIDYLPGRGREAPQFADERLTDAIWRVASGKPTLVDQDGVLRSPAQIELHPEDLREEWLKLWADHPGRPDGWVHHSAERRERRARVALILGRAGRSDTSVVRWLEALVTDGKPEGSAAAVRIVAGMVEAGHALAEQAARARVVLTESGGFVAPVRGEVFRRSTTDSLSDRLVYVDERVVDSFGVTSALDLLGVREADAAGRFAAVVDRGFADYTDDQWIAFWELGRAAGAGAVLEALRAQAIGVRRDVRVRTVAGGFRPASDCLLPGPVVPADGSRDGTVAVDLEFHADDREVLPGLGLLDGPVVGQDPTEEPWFEEYRTFAWEFHLRSLDDKAHRPQQATMRVDGASPAGPLRFIRALSPVGRAAFIENLPSHGLTTQWTVQAGRQQSTRKPIRSPLLWMAWKEGHLRTSRGLRPVAHCVAPSLREHHGVLPVAQVSPAIAAFLRLPSSLAKVQPGIWREIVADAAESTDDAFPGKVYALLLEAGADWPDGATTRCRIGDGWSSDTNDHAIAVTAVLAEYETMVREGVPALLAPDAAAADRMVEAWGMLTAAEVITKEIRFVAESEPVLLVDLFPHVRSHLRQRLHDGETWTLTRCTELEEITRTPNGMRTTQLPRARFGSSVLVLRPEDDFAALMAVDDVLGLDLGASGCRSVLDRRQRQRDTERIRAVREAPTTEQKLLRLVGTDALRAGLPAGLEEREVARTGSAPSPERVVQLAVNTHGEGILRHHSKDITAGNVEAPRTFAGGTAARRYVAELGLPGSLAGSAAVTPPEMEEVEGPADLPPLHDYQEHVATAMVDLLLQPMPERAMLRLPTGAGKTRVAVEAVIRVVRERGVEGPVLWIAQSDELCEQAVEAWKFVWSKVGPEQRLTINRFWGGNDAAQVLDTTQLVVATDAKLTSRLQDEDYAWLRQPSIVIVDEAHRAIARSYTAILEQLGLTSRRTDRPLVGLTATPFRGRNVQETQRLVDRFGGRRLDDGLFPDDPYPALQAIGVLAKVEHRELPGATISLDLAQLAGITTFGTLPSSAEEELGRDMDRNEMLLEAIAELPDDWPVLVFATSVNHSNLLTAMLNDRGIGSTSIDSYTPMPERRRKIEAYRSLRTRVITNYGVLAQGFDAPRTRAVVIARPTYSPNVYQQMIGRGLRGPRNGGSETCLILDVHDNVENYGKSLAFTEFEHLWGVG